MQLQWNKRPPASISSKLQRSSSGKAAPYIYPCTEPNQPNLHQYPKFQEKKHCIQRTTNIDSAHSQSSVTLSQ
jgi:hypothetical protein